MGEGKPTSRIGRDCAIGPGASGWIDKGVPFQWRDSRYWQLKAAERMQVRVVAYDRAGNRAESDPVWVNGPNADRSDAALVVAYSKRDRVFDAASRVDDATIRTVTVENPARLLGGVQEG